MKSPNAEGVRRSWLQINNCIYMSAGDLTEEEQSRKEQIIQLNMKPYDQTLDKNTAMFTVVPVEEIF